MLASLTWELVALPSRAWPRYAKVSARTEAADAVLRAAAVGGVAAIATCLGAAAHPRASVSFVVVPGLAAVAGYVGTAAIAGGFLPQLLARSVAAATEASSPTLVPSDELSRFASAAVLPMLASGIAHAIPFAGFQVVAALLGAVATYYSGSLGARALLGMEGASRKRVATLTALVSTPPALLAALLIASR